MSRRIELWTSIQELNEQGEYSSVELHPGKDISTGGIFQLRQVRQHSGKVPLKIRHALKDEARLRNPKRSSTCAPSGAQCSKPSV